MTCFIVSTLSKGYLTLISQFMYVPFFLIVFSPFSPNTCFTLIKTCGKGSYVVETNTLKNVVQGTTF